LGWKRPFEVFQEKPSGHGRGAANTSGAVPGLQRLEQGTQDKNTQGQAALGADDGTFGLELPAPLHTQHQLTALPAPSPS